MGFYSLYMKARRCVENLHSEMGKRMLSKFWDAKISAYIKDKNILTAQEEKAACDFFAKWTKITTVCHAFYKEKKGEFLPNYVPASLFYSRIDQFYNNWKEGRIVDNKVNYYTMFPEVKQPELVCYRSGGFWLRGGG